MTTFIQLLNHISNQVKQEIEINFHNDPNDNFDLKLNAAIVAWCNYLVPSQEISIVVSYISQGIKLYGIENIANYIYKDWKPEKRQRFTLAGMEEYWKKSRLFNLVEQIFQTLGSSSMNIIIFIAFVITVVGYYIYTLNKPKQQESTTRQPDYRPTPSAEPSDQVSQLTSTVSPPSVPVQQITQKLLILVVSAAQESIIDFIKAKRTIDYDDCKKLYDATQYLCQDNESNLGDKFAYINQFKAIEKSEYDIYIVKIKLNQADKGFNKNVNQLDRYDAFRNLPNLAVDFQVSDRLQMEAYGNFDVYNR